jgi:hypothetical protein
MTLGLPLEEAVMELVDWGTVLALAAAGAVLVSAAWLLVPLAFSWFRGPGGPARRSTRRVAKHERSPGVADPHASHGEGSL